MRDIDTTLPFEVFIGVMALIFAVIGAACFSYHFVIGIIYLSNMLRSCCG